MSDETPRRSTLTVRYRCCSDAYVIPCNISTTVSVAEADRRHAVDHPGCPPLDVGVSVEGAATE